MAEPHDQGAAAERYAAIEAAYCEDRWGDVLTQGRKLLEDLGPEEDALATALRQRLHLLMAHTHLHGLGDRDTAEDLYRQVLNTANAEPALRRSAEEGLQQCARPTIRPPAETEAIPSAVTPPSPAPSPAPERPLPEPVAPPLALDPAMPFSAGSGSSGTGPIQAAATPWLQADPEPPAFAVPAEEAEEIDAKTPAWESEPESEPTSTPTTPPPTAAPALMADVVEEPELLDVHRADPLRAEEIELELREPPSTAAAAAQVLAASVTAEALAEMARGRAEPVAPSAAERQPQADARAIPTIEGASVTEPLPEEPAIADVPPLLQIEEEEEDDPDLLEGLLQVALG